MMTKTAEEYLEALAAELAISEARYEQARSSYQSLGEWLHRAASTVLQYDPEVYVQGSFLYGTATRPANDAEEYDVDAVCLLRLANTAAVSQAQLKELVGNEIKAYRAAKGMHKPVREGRRCWVLEYADGAQFHMDIVPCVPNAARQRMLLAARKLDVCHAETAIVITDIESPTYRTISDDWPRSNPKGYAEWFRERMGLPFRRNRQRLAESIKASVEDIPEYRVRTPLQSAIMILKRHRDGMFEDRPDDRPISIIITTLAAYAYGGEETIGGALTTVLAGMDQHIRPNGQQLVIANPSDPLENFADKWPAHPERRAAFYEWLAQARSDFALLAAQVERRRMVESMQLRLGAAASRAADRLAPPPRTMLRPAAAAPTAAAPAPSFPNQRRAPTTPKEFA
jgi:hypothetical protein